MPLDPKVRQHLDQAAALGFPASHTVSPVEARELMFRRRALLPSAPEPVARVEDRAIPGPAGEIPVRVYAPSEDRNMPVLVFFHGGGWVIGNLDTHDMVCRSLANAAGCLVVSVDYRLAPEARFPAAAEDCYAAIAWVAEHARSLGAERRDVRVGAVPRVGDVVVPEPDHVGAGQPVAFRAGSIGGGLEVGGGDGVD